MALLALQPTTAVAAARATVRTAPHAVSHVAGQATSHAASQATSIDTATPDTATDHTAQAHKALDLANLNAAQRTVFQQVVAAEFCHCDSALTIAKCLSQRPDCRMGQHLAKVAQRGAVLGASSADLLGLFASNILGPFCSKPTTTAVPHAPSHGPVNAPITVVEFADFRCSHCQKAAPILRQALQRYQGKVRFVFVPFPLNNNAQSIAAAKAVLAATDQGKFAAMYKALMHNSSGVFDDATIFKLATQAKLDIARFKKDIKNNDQVYQQRINAFKQAGIKAGIHGTPAFFVNGRPFQLMPPLVSFDDRFAMELDRDNDKCQ